MIILQAAENLHLNYFLKTKQSGQALCFCFCLSPLSLLFLFKTYKKRRFFYRNSDNDFFKKDL